jgi:hypothetical protein
MKAQHLISIIAVFGSGFLAAEEPAKKDTITTDALDISAIQKRVEEAGIPTPQSVQQLEEKAAALARDSKWQDAASAYQGARALYARTSNWLANLISAGLDPFYHASYDDQKNYSISQREIQLENLSNSYRKKRDQATVWEAECYVRMNDTRRAVPLLVKALELINIKDTELWSRARKDLYSIIQVQEPP